MTPDLPQDELSWVAPPGRRAALRPRADLCEPAMHEAYLEAGITEAAPGDLVAGAECLVARGAPTGG